MISSLGSVLYFFGSADYFQLNPFQYGGVVSSDTVWHHKKEVGDHLILHAWRNTFYAILSLAHFFVKGVLALAAEDRGGSQDQPQPKNGRTGTP